MTPDEIIKNMKQLVSLPEVASRVNELLDSPKASTEEIGEVINHDPALAARLLKLVNSAFYKFPSQIDSVSRAITLIGTDELRSLIMATAVTDSFNEISPEYVDMDAFWHRSVYCGLVAKQLAQICNVAGAEAIFLTGLLHDIGRLVLLACLPEQEKEILQQAAQSKQPFPAIEAQVLGFTSTELGAKLLESWRLPKKLWLPIRFQHTPDAAAEHATEARLLKLARHLTDCVEPELKTEVPFDMETLEDVELNGVILTGEDLGAIVSATDLECFAVLMIVNPRAALIY